MKVRFDMNERVAHSVLRDQFTETETQNFQIEGLHDVHGVIERTGRVHDPRRVRIRPADAAF